MDEYIKKSDMLAIIEKYEKTAPKVYKNEPNIKSLNITKLKKELMELKTYTPKKPNKGS